MNWRKERLEWVRREETFEMGEQRWENKGIFLGQTGERERDPVEMSRILWLGRERKRGVEHSHPNLLISPVTALPSPRKTKNTQSL